MSRDVGGWEAEWGLGRLVGEWSFERTIRGQGCMTGVAVVEPVGDGRMNYRESGELRLEDGQRLRGEQRYVYERLDQGFAVRFHGTGELFHRVMFRWGEGGLWKASAEHTCKADVYVSEYVFRGDGTFSVEHVVRGPRKDYVIATCYRR